MMYLSDICVLWHHSFKGHSGATCAVAASVWRCGVDAFHERNSMGYSTAVSIATIFDLDDLVELCDLLLD